MVHFFATDIEPSRLAKGPAAKRAILVEGKEIHQGFLIKYIEIRQYLESTDSLRGPYSLLTFFLETDKGTVEVKYDEGYRGTDAINAAYKMLTQYVGLASAINRALIELRRLLPQ